MWTWSGADATAWSSWLFLVLLITGVSLLAVVLVRVLAAEQPGARRRSDGTSEADRQRVAAHAPAPPSALDVLDDRHGGGEPDAAGYDDERVTRLRSPGDGDPG